MGRCHHGPTQPRRLHDDWCGQWSPRKRSPLAPFPDISFTREEIELRACQHTKTIDVHPGDPGAIERWCAKCGALYDGLWHTPGKPTVLIDHRRSEQEIRDKLKEMQERSSYAPHYKAWAEALSWTLGE